MASFGRRELSILTLTLGVCLLIVNPLCIAFVQTFSHYSTGGGSESSAPGEAGEESALLSPAGRSSRTRPQGAFASAARPRLAEFRSGGLVPVDPGPMAAHAHAHPH